jgi:hypothetical protein
MWSLSKIESFEILVVAHLEKGNLLFMFVVSEWSFRCAESRLLLRLHCLSVRALNHTVEWQNSPFALQIFMTV